MKAGMKSLKSSMRTIGKRICFLLLIAVISNTFVQADTGQSNNPVAEARNGIVRILTIDGSGYGFSTGTGFGVGKAGEETTVFVTNWHVVTGSGEYTDPDIYIILSDDALYKQYYSDDNGEEDYYVEVDFSKLIPCEVVDTTNGYPDVAVIRISQPIAGRIALPLMKAEEAEVAQKVYALGFPGDADNYAFDTNNATQAYWAEPEKVVTSDGTISRFVLMGQADNNKVIQHTAEINHGNSGGPLITEDGAAIAINTYSVGESGYPTSIYIEYAMELLDANHISYDMYKESFHLPGWIIPAAVAVLAAVIIGMILAIRQKKTNHAHEKEINDLEDKLKNMLEDWQKEAKLKDSGFRLEGLSGVYKGRRFAIGKQVKIGRSGDCQLRYPADTEGVSGVHCELVIKNEHLYIMDLGSTYGTILKDSTENVEDQLRTIPAHKYLELTEGTEICLGSEEERFRICKK